MNLMKSSSKSLDFDGVAFDGPHDTGFPRVIQTRKRTPKTNAGGCMFVCFNSTVLEVTCDRFCNILFIRSD